jgi:hypothetical protein
MIGSFTASSFSRTGFTASSFSRYWIHCIIVFFSRNEVAQDGRSKLSINDVSEIIFGGGNKFFKSSKPLLTYSRKDNNKSKPLPTYSRKENNKSKPFLNYSHKENSMKQKSKTTRKQSKVPESIPESDPESFSQPKVPKSVPQPKVAEMAPQKKKITPPVKAKTTIYSRKENDKKQEKKEKGKQPESDTQFESDPLPEGDAQLKSDPQPKVPEIATLSKAKTYSRKENNKKQENSKTRKRKQPESDPQTEMDPQPEVLESVPESDPQPTVTESVPQPIVYEISPQKENITPPVNAKTIATYKKQEKKMQRKQLESDTQRKVLEEIVPQPKAYKIIKYNQENITPPVMEKTPTNQPIPMEYETPLTTSHKSPCTRTRKRFRFDPEVQRPGAVTQCGDTAAANANFHIVMSEIVEKQVRQELALMVQDYFNHMMIQVDANAQQMKANIQETVAKINEKLSTFSSAL